MQLESDQQCSARDLIAKSIEPFVCLNGPVLFILKLNFGTNNLFIKAIYTLIKDTKN